LFVGAASSNLPVPTIDFMAIEQAVILAGGLGTRMRPMTEQVPKPMLPVNGKPFLYHQLRLVESRGFRRVLLLVGYLGEQIERYFDSEAGALLEVGISYSYESSPLGTGGALRNAAAKLDAAFVVLNGDTYLDVEYAKFCADFERSDCAGMTVAYKQNDDAAGLKLKNNLAVREDGLVTRYSKQDPAGCTHVDAGATAFRKSVLSAIPDGPKCSLEEEIFPALIAEEQLKAWATDTRFIDMGSPTGLAALQEKLR
jgi:NDP-sugar pyrophosphorylase family protein